MSDHNSKEHCPAVHGFGSLTSRLERLEQLLIDGLSQDISEHLDSYIFRLRQMRSDHFPANYFSDVMWDVLLELNEAARLDRRLSVSDLGLRTNIPGTTVLRYLAVLEQDGFIARSHDQSDGRRFFVSLTEEGALRMEQLLRNFVDTVNKDLEKARLKKRMKLVA